MHRLQYWLILYKKGQKIDRTPGTDVTNVGGGGNFRSGIGQANHVVISVGLGKGQISINKSDLEVSRDYITDYILCH
jgi:hypothetical protein